MLTAAFLFEIILASIVIASTSASFSRCVSCPCGSGSQNYTHCIDESLLTDFPCERWSYCQTCKANTTFCITCPPDRFGPTCSENSHTRRKRQDDPVRLNLPRYPRQSGSCTFLERPESGSIRCSQTGNERQCTSRCLPGFHFEGEENVNEITLRCRGNAWTPRSFFPPCIYTPPVGEPQLCPVPEVDPNGEVQEFLLDSRKLTQGFEPGTELTIRCKEGYILQGWGTIRCSNNGLWSTPSPKCNVKPRSDSGTPYQTRCVNPGHISNGRVDVFPPFDDPSQPSVDDDDFEFPLGTHLKFTCEEGFSLVGEKDSMSCESNGYWSGSKPICAKNR
ncbi:hypothetical protein AVEN_126205-1 [Araneus ventricosus]|uniref:Sushi domain-containing protein n=1 Tax=Araneus ventricosus TaxID=182803 RepID=A0A4Y2ITT5_ARAVE|nr:hypothetical protein AVEN_126205-1 [Araneus ventricosus]